MALLFWRDDASHDAQTDTLFAEQASIGPAATGVLLSLVAVLIAGTLKLWPLTAAVGTLTLPLPWAEAWQATLFHWVPFDAAKGEEGVSVQGSLLIVLLLLIGLTAWKGLENIVEGANRWTWVALGLAAATLLVAALRLTPRADGLEVALTGRVLAVGLALWAVLHHARRLDADAWRAWLWEAWRFVKQIFVLLVVGVFVVGVVRQLIQPEWIQNLAGRNDLLANAVAVVLRRLHVLPDAGGGAGGAHVPRPGHAPRAAAGLSDGRPGTQPAEHADGGRRDRPAQDLRLCRPGGGVQHRGRPGLRRLGGRREPGVDRRRAGRVRRRAGGAARLAAGRRQAPARA